MTRGRQLCECGRPAAYWSKRRGRRQGGAGHELCQQCWRAEMDRMGRGSAAAGRTYLVGVVEYGRAAQLARRRRDGGGEPASERVLAVVHKALCLGLEQLERRGSAAGGGLAELLEETAGGPAEDGGGECAPRA